MRRSGRSAPFALFAGLALALGLGAAGCGGGSKSTAASVTTSTSSSSSAAATSASSSATPTSTTSTATSASATVVPKGSQQGETAYEKEVKSPTYVDPSITKYGKTASSGEAGEVTAVVNTYYAALSSHNTAKACAMLSAKLKETMIQLLARSPQLKGKGCAGILPLLLTEGGGRTIPKPSQIHIKTVRVQNGNGFVILSTPTLPAGVMHVKRVNGTWTVGTPVAVPAP